LLRRNINKGFVEATKSFSPCAAYDLTHIVGPYSGVLQGRKGFVIPTKSFIKIGIKKCFVTTKCLVLSTKRLVAAANFLVAATKKNYLLSQILLP